MIVAGIVAALAAAVANAFAVVYQAAEDRRSPPAQAGRFALLGSLVHRPRWLAGTGLMVLAWPLQILALGFAPITVVQPTLSATQLVLLGVARVKLGERVGPIEALGAVAIVAGVSAVIVAGPRHSVPNPSAGRVAVALAVVGGAALGAYVTGRLRPRRALALVLGAGFAYAWIDFVNKLLADDITTDRWGLAVVWLAATIAFGALALLEENSALQRRPAVTVAPVIGSLQEPLPVLVALFAGVESWGGAAHRVIPVILGLAAVTAGAAILGRSKAVARLSRDARR